MRWTGGIAGGCVVMWTASSCAGGIDSSCGRFYDEYIAVLTECSVDSAVSIDSSGRAGFIQDCEALAKAPGEADVSTYFDHCTSLLESVQACALFPRCTATGTLPNGAPCAAGSQCASSFCEVSTITKNPTSELTCGTCAALAPPGAACGANGIGALCDPSTACVNGTCVPLVPRGGACIDTDQDCAPSLVCNHGTCQPPPMKGQACSADYVCLIPYACINGTCSQAVTQGGSCPTGNECAAGLVCTNGTCSQPVFAQAGQSCMMAPCAAGLYCSTNGTCVARVALGGTCTVAQGECANGLLCASGTCQVPDYTACK